MATRFAKDLTTHLYGNPHSASPSSERSTRRVEGVRARLLRFFRADPEYFDLVFTANTTASIKIVADAFRDTDGGFWYGYQRDAHTSLVGVREYAEQAQCFETDPALDAFLKGDDQDANEARKSGRVGLFAWPAQSNMNGRRLPLDLAGRVRATAPAGQTTYTMLDAAAYCTTGQLDLSDINTSPDFTALSLHKVFGFPDLGVLIVRKSAGVVFDSRRYFGGGTVEMVTVIREQWVSRRETNLHERLEDGTLPFHQIVALDSALNVHAELYGCMTNITQHTCALAASLYKRLRALRHAGGLSVCEIYKDQRSQYGNSKTQGPTVAFNVRNAQGGWMGKSDVEALAVARGIHLRTGGVCNPGGIASHCSLEHWEMRRNFAEGMRCGDNFDVLGGKPTGVVRVSLGAMSTPADVDAFVDFIEAVFVETELDVNPYQFSSVNADTEAQGAVRQLRLFPVRGCAGWKVPYYVSWGIGDRGLMWDREWCIISKDTNQALEASQHPRLKLIEPFISAERGTIRLTGPKARTKTSFFIGDGREGAATLSPINENAFVGLDKFNKPEQVSVVVAAMDASPPSRDEEEEELCIELSLWESPAPTTPDLNVQGLPLADAYEAAAVADFCTAVLGVPCTLARFRDLRRMAKDSPELVKNLPVTDRSVRIAADDGECFCPGNVGVSGTSLWQTSRYVQIGSEYFENPYAVAIDATTDLTISSALSTDGPPLRELVHLRNTFDRSRAAHNPTVAAGDRVRAFTTDAALRDPGLQACIASTFVEGRLCPVWDCRRAFATQEALVSHYADHRYARPKTPPAAPAAAAAPPRPAEIQILQMAVNLPESVSEKFMASVGARGVAAGASGAGLTEPAGPPAVPSPTSMLSRRSTTTSRRQSWRNKLSGIIRPGSLLSQTQRVN